MDNHHDSPDAPHFRRIVGFDFGHGESAAVLCEPTVGESSPITLEILPNRSTIVTMVAEHPELGVLIGERAADTPGSIRSALGFKAPVDRATSDQLRATELFVRGCVDSLRSAVHRDFGADTLFVFGHPSGWTPTQIEGHRRTLAAAVSPAQVQLVPESRAAFLSARSTGQVINSDLEGPVLIVDVGSSTTDFTVIEGTTSRPIEGGDFGGIPLGAGLLDTALLELAVGRHERATELHSLLCSDERGAVWWNRLKLDCRQSKERFYGDESTYRSANPPEILTQRRRIARDFTVDFDFTAADFDRVERAHLPALGASWRERFAHDLEAAKALLPGPPRLVLLTGGAARMRFVLDATRRTFPDAGRVVRAEEPGVAIARGLALAGAVSARVAKFRGAVRDLVRSDDVEMLVAAHLPGLASAVGDSIAPGFGERFVLPEIDRWRNGHIATLAGVGEAVADRLSAWQAAEDGRRQLSATTASWHEQLVVDLRSLTDPICKEFGIEPESLRLDGMRRSTSVDRVRTTETLLDAPLEIAGGVLACAGAVGAVVAFGSGMALVAATGPIAPIVAAIAWIVTVAVGMDAAKEKVMTMDLPMGVRSSVRPKMVRWALNSKRDEVERDVRSSISRALTDPRGEDERARRERLVGDLAEQLEARLLGQAAAAEVLIS